MFVIFSFFFLRWINPTRAVACHVQDGGAALKAEGNGRFKTGYRWPLSELLVINFTRYPLHQSDTMSEWGECRSIA